MDNKLLSALAEPTRLKIVELLRDCPQYVNEVAKKLDISQPQASKHLKYLTGAGILTMKPVAQKRIYVLNQEPFLQLNDWLNSFESYWSNKFTNLDDYLNKVKKG